MLRQLNVKRQLTIPSRLAKRFGLSGRSWVDVTEGRGVLLVSPVDVEAQRATPLDLTDADWKAFNRHVERELKAGKGTVHADAAAFLHDLQRRLSAKGGSAAG